MRGRNYVVRKQGEKIVNKNGSKSPSLEDEELTITNAKRFAEINRRNELDAQMGFPPLLSGARVGWMVSMQPTWVMDVEWPSGRSAVDYYFMADDGSCFKATLKYSPYFFLKCLPGTENEVEDYLRRRFENAIESMEKVCKEDLDMPNHLSGVKRCYLKLLFRNTADLLAVRKILLPIAIKNGEGYKEVLPSFNAMNTDEKFDLTTKKKSQGENLSKIVGLREYDIPYHLRAAIDLNIRVGLWYTVSVSGPLTTLNRILDKDVRPDLVVLAFDIETSKMPLKFPDPQQDHIMMISYMINGQGFLIVNRDIVSQDIENFEYTPKPDFPGHFTVFNETDELALLNRFFTHIQIVRPQVFVTYNGDFFDWPFIEKRASIHGLNMADLIGIGKNAQDEFGGTFCSHMDCFAWVKRDSYLPAGSHGLKAVCAVKLGYDPLELDPELMTPLASQDPHTLANYSVSDAVATYYLYQKYVHPFIFSLCTIIPLGPDEVLRKGTGTLCETLLMAQAHQANVIMPNKYEEPRERFHRGHLLESETYIGGHVEALEAGVYRSDFTYRFKIDAPTIYRLVDELDRALRFFLEHEAKAPIEEVADYDAVYGKVKDMLVAVAKSAPVLHDRPLIYHLDVGSMYPNIILTNRLQPSAMVTEAACAVCDFNLPGKQCQRRMTWSWRGEFFSAKQNEYRMIRRQLEGERFPSRNAPGTTVPFHELSQVEQTALLKKRLADYSQKVYKKTRQHETIQKTAIICQRENAFYINTVRSFRDRRYDYKNLQKVWKKKLDEAQGSGDPSRVEEAGKMLVLYDSLQLAHKCILNSFYGYVMRKAARWYSMEMGGIVCETGAAIITLARELIEKFGRPLELDTDGIWCMLPSGFPQNFTFTTKGGKKVPFAYPCVMLNHLLFDRFTNHQYQTRQPDGTYAISSENSIFFEIDGPYRAMVLPSSTEEGKQLKKRYAVFNDDGSLAELKGFEIKRRGELQLIKIFQSQIFKTFLRGEDLQGCYQEVASVANYWLDILYNRGKSIEDSELLELISENRSMSKSLEEYGSQKSTSLSTARRLAEFLGDAMVKDKGLACKFIISAKPLDLPVTSRAIPVAIFSAAQEIRRHFLSKWLKDSTLSNADIRDIIDWDYYIERIGSMIQKLIVIPAALQHVPNPVPRVIPPEWLKKRGGVMGITSRLEQKRITDSFKIRPTDNTDGDLNVGGLVGDIESIADIKLTTSKPMPLTKRSLATTEPEVPSIAIDLPEIDLAKDYLSWMESRKNYWLRLPKPTSMEKHTNLGDGEGSNKYKVLRGNVNIRTNPWHIISVAPVEGELGLFQVWILVGGRSLRQVQIRVPRRIYIATREPSNVLGEPVHFRLPDGQTVPFLYEICLPERVYQEEFRPQWSSLVDPNVLGSWETDIPLNFYLSMKIGASVRVSKMYRDKESSIFDIDELEFCTTSEFGYLNDGSISYGFIGWVSAPDGRTLLLLVWNDEVTPLVRFMVVDEGMYRQLAVSNLRSFANQLLKTSTSMPFNYESFDFVVDYFGDLESALRSMQRAINARIDSRPQPTIILTLNAAAAARDAIQDGEFTPLSLAVGKTFPIIALPSWLGSYLLPPLDWQRNGARRLLEYFYDLNGWLKDRLQLARYAHLPLGNLPNTLEKETDEIADIFYARSLKSQGYLLSWDEISQQEFKPTANTNKSGTSNPNNDMNVASLLLTPLESSPLTTPGLYRQVTVDLNISAMAINAILEHCHLVEESEPLPTCLPLLRGLLAGWIKEMIHGNAEAIKFVEGFFHWVRARGSHLIPISFYRDTLKGLMGRARDRLHEYIRSLGCTVVHGDDHRLVVATAKDHPANARAFIEYVVNEVKKTDGLAWINLKVQAYWQALLWLDCNNFCGYQYDIREPKEIPDISLSLHVDLASYLPSLLQRPFTLLLAEYLRQVKDISLDSPPPDLTETMNPDTFPSFLVEEEPEELPLSSMNDLIPLEYRSKFLSVVREVQKIYTGAAPSPAEEARRLFPHPLGLYLSDLQGDPPTVFVRFLGAFLLLDRIVGPDAFRLLKNAYQILGIGEFSEAARFVDPSLPILLKDIICLKCRSVRDLNLTRDGDIVNERKSQLYCASCNHPYDMEAIEGELVEMLKGWLLMYQVQDLVCLKCRSVSMSPLGRNCPECAGTWRMEQPKLDLVNRLKVITRLAQHFKLPSLLFFCHQIST